jgi:hypothetical protein
MSEIICSKRTRRITLGRRSQLRVPEDTYQGFSRFCSTRNYSKTTDAFVSVLNHGLRVLGLLPESDAEIVRNSQQNTGGGLR